jgi:signal transduction histidine kinase
MAAPTEPQSAEALRQANSQLSADLAEAQRDNRGYRNLLIAAAHEMRTPLNAILLSLEMIGKLSSPEHESARKAQIERAKRVLGGYVNRTSILLDAARLTGGVFRLSREPVVLEELVSAITELYAAKAEYQGARIDVDLAPGIVGHWDRAAVETILANLVSNALKYGEGTPVVITGTTDNANAVIRIADSGPGIPDDQHTRIFEKFNRVLPSRSNVGYGLGLWIAGEFARLHGGSLILEPTSSGSTFVVTLPMGQSTIAGSAA